MVTRPTKNHVVDFNCVKIDINGLVNNNSNKRCEENNSTGDGFVYTCKTTKNREGAYEYDYEDVNKSTAWTSDKLSSINGYADKRARDTTIDYIRKEDDNNEGVINILDTDKNVRGKLTGSTTKNFIYNEGNSTKLRDGKNEDVNVNVKDAKGIQVNSISNNKEYTITEFYDKQAVAFTEHPVLTAVRDKKN